MSSRELRSKTEGEIAQQPGVWPEVLVAARTARARLGEALSRFEDAHGPAEVVMTGAGTSAHIAEICARHLMGEGRRPVRAVPSTDIVADPHGTLEAGRPRVLVSFARSGDSPESLAAVQATDALGPTLQVAVTCNADGKLAWVLGQHDGAVVLCLPAETNDVGFAMTSSATSMLLAASTLFEDPVVDDHDWLLASAAALIDGADPLGGLDGTRFARVVYVGSGPLAGCAREAALKLLELTAGRVVATSESTLGFRHGPMAILDGNSLAVVLVSSDPTRRRYDLDLAAELERSPRAPRVVTLSAENLLSTDRPAPTTPDDARLAMLMLVSAQLLAVRTSLALGLTPDQPFPGGELNRVVPGFALHPVADPSPARTNH